MRLRNIKQRQLPPRLNHYHVGQDYLNAVSKALASTQADTANTRVCTPETDPNCNFYASASTVMHPDAGDGVFTTKALAVGEVPFVYDGQLVSTLDAPGDGSYVIALTNNLWLDGNPRLLQTSDDADPGRIWLNLSPTALMNHSRHHDNVELRKLTQGELNTLLAAGYQWDIRGLQGESIPVSAEYAIAAIVTKPIGPHEELFANYFPNESGDAVTDSERNLGICDVTDDKIVSHVMQQIESYENNHTWSRSRWIGLARSVRGDDDLTHLLFQDANSDYLLLYVGSKLTCNVRFTQALQNVTVNDSLRNKIEKYRNGFHKAFTERSKLQSLSLHFFADNPVYIYIRFDVQ